MWKNLGDLKNGGLMGFNGTYIMGFNGIYPLVISYIAIENGHGSS